MTRSRCAWVLVGIALASMGNAYALSELYNSGLALPVSTETPGFPVLGAAITGGSAASVATSFSVTGDGWYVMDIRLSLFGPEGFGMVGPDQTATVGIAADAGGGIPLSSLLSTWTLSGINPEQEYSVLTSGISLLPGTYWVVVKPASGSSTDSTTIGWNLTANYGAAVSAGSPNFGANWYGGEYKPIPAYRLLGEPVPEPITMIMLGGLGAGIVAGRKLRRRC